jgi:CRISPR-associated endonuclease/helicase Cas3
MFEPLAHLLRQQSIQLHTHNHDTDPISGKRVSIGLIRLANISTIYPLAQALYAQDAPDGVQLHLCVYHAQYPLLLRSAIERQLDAALTRHNPQALFTLPDIRHRLDGSSAADHVFIVLSSPVSEVGRDHCYNWAIAEPSSMRSLIQLAGRVRRHWPQPWSVRNLLILQHNLAAWQGKKPAYCRPGFENKDFPLDETDLASCCAPKNTNTRTPARACWHARRQNSARAQPDRPGTPPPASRPQPDPQTGIAPQQYWRSQALRRHLLAMAAHHAARRPATQAALPPEPWRRMGTGIATG